MRPPRTLRTSTATDAGDAVRAHPDECRLQLAPESMLNSAAAATKGPLVHHVSAHRTHQADATGSSVEAAE